MKKARERSKSLGHILHQASDFKLEPTNKDTDIRSVCRRVAPYIVRGWREVCDELGVPDDRLDTLQDDYGSAKMSEVAYQGLCLWLDMVGRFASHDRLLKAVRSCGLKRAEDELKSVQERKQVPCFAKPPVTDSQSKDTSVNRQAKQKANVDRLSRPKSLKSEPGGETAAPQSQHHKRRPSFMADNVNPLLVRPVTTKQSELCEVKVKVTVKGVQRKGTTKVESTRDDYASTKDDYKHTCHTFVRLVMANQQTHFKQLKHKLGFQDVAVIGLSKIGFNIQLCVVCFKLGALEILLQAYETKRLHKIVHSCLVTRNYMDKLGVEDIELAVSIDEGLINKNRHIVITRNSTAELPNHPVEGVEVCKYLLDGDQEVHAADMPDITAGKIRSFQIRSWHDDLNKDIGTINERLRVFLSTVKDFLIILRILKPADKANINNLHDVIECFHHIRNTKHLNRGTHAVVVEEYLSIVNQIRLKVLSIHESECLLAFDESMNDDTNERFQTHLHELDAMLEPDFEFVNVVNEMEILEPGLTLQTLLKEIESEDGDKLILSSIERDVYGGCLCFIPALIGKLGKLSDVFEQALCSVGDMETSSRKLAVLGDNVASDVAGKNQVMSVSHNDIRMEQTVA